MKTMFLLLVSLALLAGSSSTLAGQNHNEGLRAINLAYQNHPQLSMDITYKVFASWAATTPLQEERGALKRSDNLTWLKIGAMEFVQNPNYSVVVDHDDKTIAIMGIYGDLPAVHLQEVLPDMENALLHCQEIKHTDLTNNRGQYELGFPTGSSVYKKVRLTYDKTTHLLQMLTLYYAEAQDITDHPENDVPPRLEITYTNINTHPTLAADLFTYAAFLKKAGPLLVCQEKYARYALIDKYSRP